MVHLLWPWYICLRLSLFLWAKKKNHSWFLCFLAFSHFCHSYYFMKSDSWYSVSFQFPFQQPCLSAHYNVPKISPYQEAILKLHSATFVISFQEWAFMEIQKTTHLKNSTCLCSTSHVAVCLLIWVCLTTCFGQSTRAPQTSTESQTAILSPRIIYTLM